MIKRSSFLQAAYYLEVHSWSAEGCKAEIPFLHNHFPEWSTALQDEALQLGWQIMERHFDRMRAATAERPQGMKEDVSILFKQILLKLLI
jgi:hypothetical protein